MSLCISVCIVTYTEKKRVNTKFLSGFSSIVRMQCNVCIENFCMRHNFWTRNERKMEPFSFRFTFYVLCIHGTYTQNHTRKIKWNSRTGMLFALKSRSLYHHRSLLLSWYTVWYKRNDYTIILCTHDAIKNYQIFMNVGVNVWNMCLSSFVCLLRVWFQKRSFFKKKEGFLFIDWCQMWSTRFFGAHTHTPIFRHIPD